MKQTHTQGPWYATPNPEWRHAKWRIGNVPGVPWERAGEIAYVKGEANARLIAAAPELLEALEASRKAINTLDEDALGMVTREDGHGGINYWPFKVELLHQIDTAIAKARGQE